MDFDIKLRPSGTDETNAAADAVKNVRTELDKAKAAPPVKIPVAAPKIPPKVKPQVEEIKVIAPKVPPPVLRELARDAENARKELARLQAEQRNLKAAGFDPGARVSKDVAARAEIARGRVAETESKFISAGGGGFDAKAYDKAEKDKEKASKDRSKGSLSSAIAVKSVLAQQGVEVLKWAAGMARANFQLALGTQGGARLAMISAQASFNWRRLFMGTNPKPFLDSIQRTAQLIDPRTFTGKELGGLITRSADRIFAMLSKAEPYVRLFFKGMLLGGLQVEGMWLNLLIAAQPVLNMFPKGIGLMSTFEAGALAVKGAVALMGIGVAAGLVKATGAMLSFGISAFSATAPLLPFAAAIGGIVAAVTQLQELLKSWDENSWSQITTKLKGDLGFASKEETEAAMAKRQGIVSGDEYDRKFKLGKYAEKAPASATPLPKGADKQAAAAGPPIGKNLGLGMLQGMKDTEAKVAAGGRDLVLAAEGGAKSAAEIKSPARKWRREIGQNLGEGAALGLEDSAARMEGAAASLIPSAPGVGGGALGRAGVVIQQIGPFFGMPAGGEEQVRRWVFDALDDAAERMGALA